LDQNRNLFHPIFDGKRDTWVFDLDNTLYAADCDLFSQIDRNIGAYVQKLLDLPSDEARKVQKGYLLSHGTTLRGLMADHHIDPDHYLAQVHDIDFSPIEPDPALRASLEKLNGRKLVFTNADAPYARKILGRLGIEDLFEDIFDIRSAELEPKPKREVYDKFLRDHKVDPTRAVMFEDMARNLIPAHALGMGTVWVNTGTPWGEADHDADKIHAETPLLTDWLQAFLNR